MGAECVPDAEDKTEGPERPGQHVKGSPGRGARKGKASCHDELAELSEAAGALAYATEASAPPPALRTRILDQARAERPNVVPLRPRWLRPVIAAAAVAACAAIGLGLWAASLAGKLDRSETKLANQQRVAQILADPGSHKISFSRGTLVVAPDGRGALVLTKLADPDPTAPTKRGSPTAVLHNLPGCSPGERRSRSRSTSP
ncbi:MAG: hypothetical protein ACXVRS_15135, partial [Gaiellaceae bacterium]